MVSGGFLCLELRLELRLGMVLIMTNKRLNLEAWRMRGMMEKLRTLCTHRIQINSNEPIAENQQLDGESDSLWEDVTLHLLPRWNNGGESRLSVIGAAVSCLCEVG